MTAPVFWLTGWFPYMFFSLLSLSMWGLAMGFFGANTMPITCLVVDARYRATAIGLLNACTAIFGGIALYGVVDNEADKNVAGIKAHEVPGTFGVDNFLIVEVCV